MKRQEYKQHHSEQYYKIVGRFIKQMEREVIKLLGKHPGVGINTAWDIVSDALRQADNITTGGYKR